MVSMAHSVCLVNEPGRIFGNALVAKKWIDVVKRKEYRQYRKSMLFVLENAEKHRLYCPDIYIKYDILHICYSMDNRFVNFYIEPDNQISYEYGTTDSERNLHPWSNRSRMASLSAFVNGE